MQYSYSPPRNPVPRLFLCKRHVYVRSILKNSKVLDIGCNRYKIISSATSLDIDKDVRPSIRGSGLFLPFKDKCFDSATALEVIEHFSRKDQARFLEEIYRILRPRGQLIVSTPNLWPNRRTHDLLWNISHWIYAKEDLGKHIGELTHSQLKSFLARASFNIKTEKAFSFFNYVVEAEKT